MKPEMFKRPVENPPAGATPPRGRHLSLEQKILRLVRRYRAAERRRKRKLARRVNCSVTESVLRLDPLGRATPKQIAVNGY